MPTHRLAEGVRRFDDWFGVYPLLVFPVRIFDRGPMSGFLRPEPAELDEAKHQPVHPSGTQVPSGLWVDLGAYGVPKTIADLAAHRCITYRRPRNGQIRQWRLKGAPLKAIIPEKAHMTFNSGEGLIAAAASGIGVIQVGRYYVQPMLDSGALVEVLPDHRTHAYDISVLFQQKKRMAPRLRVFINFLVDIFSPPPWDKPQRNGMR
jgi:hypothetical protein